MASPRSRPGRRSWANPTRHSFLLYLPHSGAGRAGHAEHGARPHPAERPPLLEADRCWCDALPVWYEPRGGAAHPQPLPISAGVCVLCVGCVKAVKAACGVVVVVVVAVLLLCVSTLLVLLLLVVVVMVLVEVVVL